MKTLLGAGLLVGLALCGQTAHAQQTLTSVPPPPSSLQIISEVPGALSPQQPVYPYPPAVAAPQQPVYPYPPAVAYGNPPPPVAPPPSAGVGYGSSMAPGYRPMTPQTPDYGTAQPGEENYR
jgi:hypothetical protein